MPRDIVNGSRLTDSTCDNIVDPGRVYFQSTVHVALLTRYLHQFELAYTARTGKGRREVDVLDVGCNNGAALRMYFAPNFQTQRRRPLNYTGLDLDERALSSARQNVPESTMVRSVRFISHDITTPWPLEDESQDVIWYTEAIEHVPAETAQFTLHETYRVARHGAMMLLATPAPFDPTKLVWPDSHDHEFTRQEIRDMINKSGWEHVDEYGVNTNWTYGRRRLREVNPELFALYEKLRSRVGGTIARTVAAALAPDVCDDLVHVCRKE